MAPFLLEEAPVRHMIVATEAAGLRTAARDDGGF
jgi:hypothetical protein